MKFSTVFLFLALLCSTALAEPPPAPTAYYDSMKDGLDVADLDHLGPLDEEQKKMASAILEFYQSRPLSLYDSCRSNLKNTGTALEMWSTDYEGAYPTTLAPLSPSYLYVNLSCPSTEFKPYEYVYQAEDRYYKVTCPGDHSDVGAANPSYDSEEGLRSDKPVMEKWTLQSYTVENTDQFANCVRVREVWTDGEETYDHRTQYKPRFTEAEGSHCWSLSDDGIALVDGNEVLTLMDGNFREKPLVPDDVISDELWDMSPAQVGFVVHEFVTAPGWQDAWKRMQAASED